MNCKLSQNVDEETRMLLDELNICTEPKRDKYNLDKKDPCNYKAPGFDRKDDPEEKNSGPSV
ncbi:MAG TPA: hypothetical protein DCP90_06795 [Clostridiales bacterium]|nr:MAG: hypothetical protein A2Y22_01405 [Clostridiales bacterium GWD2_32_59]HAN10302.1 hypothetical protein [Clostridiales bacterium]